MKRGRPSKRGIIQKNVLSVLDQKKTPLTISALTRILSERTGERISWNTVYKYVDELVQANRVKVIKLPHSKESDKDGLSVYMLNE